MCNRVEDLVKIGLVAEFREDLEVSAEPQEGVKVHLGVAAGVCAEPGRDHTFHLQSQLR